MQIDLSCGAKRINLLGFFYRIFFTVVTFLPHLLIALV